MWYLCSHIIKALQSYLLNIVYELGAFQQQADSTKTRRANTSNFKCYVQAHLRDIAGSVPDYHNKASTAIE